MDNPIVWLIISVMDIYFGIVIASVILSWLLVFEVVSMRNRIVYMASDVLYRLTEPALKPIRRYMPELRGVDLSPLVLILLLFFAKRSVYWVYMNVFL